MTKSVYIFLSAENQNIFRLRGHSSSVWQIRTKRILCKEQMRNGSKCKGWLHPSMELCLIVLRLNGNGGIDIGLGNLSGFVRLCMLPTLSGDSISALNRSLADSLGWILRHLGEVKVSVFVSEWLSFPLAGVCCTLSLLPQNVKHFFIKHNGL